MDPFLEKFVGLLESLAGSWSDDAAKTAVMRSQAQDFRIAYEQGTLHPTKRNTFIAEFSVGGRLWGGRDGKDIIPRLLGKDGLRSMTPARAADTAAAMMVPILDDIGNRRATVPTSFGTDSPGEVYHAPPSIDIPTVDLSFFDDCLPAAVPNFLLAFFRFAIEGAIMPAISDSRKGPMQYLQRRMVDALTASAATAARNEEFVRESASLFPTQFAESVSVTPQRPDQVTVHEEQLPRVSASIASAYGVVSPATDESRRMQYERERDRDRERELERADRERDRLEAHLERQSAAMAAMTDTLRQSQQLIGQLHRPKASATPTQLIAKGAASYFDPKEPLPVGAKVFFTFAWKSYDAKKKTLCFHAKATVGSGSRGKQILTGVYWPAEQGDEDESDAVDFTDPSDKETEPLSWEWPNNALAIKAFQMLSTPVDPDDYRTWTRLLTEDPQSKECEEFVSTLCDRGTHGRAIDAFCVINELLHAAALSTNQQTNLKRVLGTVFEFAPKPTGPSKQRSAAPSASTTTALCGWQTRRDGKVLSVCKAAHAQDDCPLKAKFMAAKIAKQPPPAAPAKKEPPTRTNRPRQGNGEGSDSE